MMDDDPKRCEITAGPWSHPRVVGEDYIHLHARSVQRTEGQDP